eukprot:6859783-Prymnesium_polylepis.1
MTPVCTICSAESNLSSTLKVCDSSGDAPGVQACTHAAERRMNHTAIKRSGVQGEILVDVLGSTRKVSPSVGGSARIGSYYGRWAMMSPVGVSGHYARPAVPLAR